MDIQFYGANCIVLSQKGARIVVDDNLSDLGAKSITKAEDVSLFTGPHGQVNSRLMLDSPGEYEVSDISVIGIAARSHLDEADTLNVTIFKIVSGDLNVLITGHIYPKLSEKQLEEIGIIDVMIVPVGGNGFTVDPDGALTLIKEVEPKIVIPTHYEDNSLHFPVPQKNLSDALKEMAMEPKETTAKLRLKTSEISDLTQLIILEKV